MKGWKLKGIHSTFRSKYISTPISASEEAFMDKEDKGSMFSSAKVIDDIDVKTSSNLVPQTNACLVPNKHKQLRDYLETMFEKTIVDSVLQDIINHHLGVSFDDIAASSVAKRLLHEAILLPIILPEFFTGIREPWKVNIY